MRTAVAAATARPPRTAFAPRGNEGRSSTRMFPFRALSARTTSQSCTTVKRGRIYTPCNYPHQQGEGSSARPCGTLESGSKGKPGCWAPCVRVLAARLQAAELFTAVPCGGPSRPGRAVAARSSQRTGGLSDGCCRRHSSARGRSKAQQNENRTASARRTLTPTSHCGEVTLGARSG